nr:hypothetical protein [Mycoplasmopsis bovis]
MKYWPSQITKPIKITLARWDWKKFIERLIAGYDMDNCLIYELRFKARSIYNLFDRITIDTKRG